MAAAILAPAELPHSGIALDANAKRFVRVAKHVRDGSSQVLRGRLRLPDPARYFSTKALYPLTR